MKRGLVFLIVLIVSISALTSCYSEGGSHKPAPIVGERINADLSGGANTNGQTAIYSSSYGNKPDNIACGGLMAFSGGYIYYRSGAETLMRSDGFNSIKLSDDDPRYINVSGGVVVYAAKNDNKKLMAVNHDGKDPRILYGSRVDMPIVIGGYCYFIAEENGNGIYRVNVNGDPIVEIIYSEPAFYLHSHGGLLYFQAYSGDSYRLFSIEKDGKDKKEVLNIGQNTRAVAFNSGRIFYRGLIKADGLTKYRIFSSDLSGGDIKQISYNEPECLNAAGGRLYYINADGGNRLFSIGFDAESEREEDAAFSKHIFEIDSYIYVYVQADKSLHMKRVLKI